jgi:hypothetical protein
MNTCRVAATTPASSRISGLYTRHRRHQATHFRRTAAVRASLEADGIVDPANVAMVGGSWDGYLTLFALAPASARLSTVGKPTYIIRLNWRRTICALALPIAEAKSLSIAAAAEAAR